MFCAFEKDVFVPNISPAAFPSHAQANNHPRTGNAANPHAIGVFRVTPWSNRRNVAPKDVDSSGSSSSPLRRGAGPHASYIAFASLARHMQAKLTLHKRRRSSGLRLSKIVYARNNFVRAMAWPDWVRDVDVVTVT